VRVAQCEATEANIVAANSYLPVPIRAPARSPKAYTRLGIRQQRAIALFLAGESKSAIANAIGLSQAAVSMIISNPLTQDLLERASRDNELEMKALLPLAIDGMRRAMKDDDPDVALRGSKAYFYTTGRAGVTAQAPVTAEDVVARILEITTTGTTTIRYAEKSQSSYTMLPDREGDDE
jgi:hypothetical protein